MDVYILCQASVINLLNLTRYDCPKEWPELIPNLIEVIKNGNLLMQFRGLHTLNQVVKALASKRLIGDRRLFQLVSAEIFQFVFNNWNILFQDFIMQVLFSSFFVFKVSFKNFANFCEMFECRIQKFCFIFRLKIIIHWVLKH